MPRWHLGVNFLKNEGMGLRLAMADGDGKGF